MKLEGLISLRQIEGVITSHHGFVKREMERRKDALGLEYVDDISKLAKYVGGVVEHSEAGGWTIKKEVFPGANIHFIYEQGDDEFPSNIRILYSGERVRSIPGEDLSHFAVGYANHMLRYVREANPGKELPRICYVV